jgi:hypothetical protein
MLDFTPERMDQRFDLQFKVNAAVVEHVIAVDPEARETVALDLRLRHMQIHVYILENNRKWS